MGIDEQRALVPELKKGSEIAFERFVFVFKDKIKGMAYNITQDPEAAEDIAQNVFISVFRKIGLFRNESRLSSWVYRIAMNEIFMYYRKSKKNYFQEFDDNRWLASKSLCPENTLLFGEFKKLLKKSIRKLGEKEMAVFVCRDIEEMSTNEVCKTLKATIPAVKSRLLRGRRKLRKSDIGRYLAV